jgi:uncharacterized membrane protein YbhN (UPF0104 family)
MSVAAMIDFGDLGSSVEAFGHAISAFASTLADIGWGYLLAGLLLALAVNLARGHAWANALRAAYPGGRVGELGVVGSFLVGAGMNAALPGRGGDAIKVLLAKRSIEGAAYPTIISSFAALAPFDAAAGILVLLYAVTEGLLPRPPELPSLPAFDISFWAAHPIALAILAGGLAIGAILLVAVVSRHIDAFWTKLKLGLAIFRRPPRYLREVASWQLLAWGLRFASFWMFLDAFHIGGSIQTVLVVLSVQSIAGSLPFTPGGIGSSQALLVATLSGPSRAGVLAYSVGQQIAVTAWSIAVAFGVLLLVFHVTDWRRLLHEGEGEAARAEASAGGS